MAALSALLAYAWSYLGMPGKGGAWHGHSPEEAAHASFLCQGSAVRGPTSDPGVGSMHGMFLCMKTRSEHTMDVLVW